MTKPREYVAYAVSTRRLYALYALYEGAEPPAFMTMVASFKLEPQDLGPPAAHE